MALYTTSILKPRRIQDGLRVSVMSRHTHDDGITPDERIVDYDLHLPELGPSPALIGSYLRRRLDWEQFAQQYRTQMHRPAAHLVLVRLAAVALISDVTLLCIEREAHRCHRSILADLMLREFPSIGTKHR